MLHKVDDILSKHALRRTAFRQELLKIFIESGSRALSHTDIEEALGDHDRITLYRTLKSFQDKGLIHEAVDGGKDTKYALCQNQCDVHHHIDHHLYESQPRVLLHRSASDPTRHVLVRLRVRL